MSRQKLYFQFFAAAVTLCATNLAIVNGKSANKASTATRNQQGIERVIKRVKLAGDPVALVDVHLSGQSIKDQENVLLTRSTAEVRELKLNGNDDWLRSLSFTFKNVSGRTIVAMPVEFIVRHPELDAPWMFPLLPSRELPFRLEHGSTTTQTLSPNEEITYSVRSTSLSKLEAELKRLQATRPVTTIEVEVGLVQFDHDNGWNDGSFYRRDPSNPKSWIRVRAAASLYKKPWVTKIAFSTSSRTAGKGRRPATTCLDASNDLWVHCSGSGWFWCETMDEGVGYDFGPYYTERYRQLNDPSVKQISTCCIIG
jgi:hypothetical protein